MDTTSHKPNNDQSAPPRQWPSGLVAAGGLIVALLLAGCQSTPIREAPREAMATPEAQAKTAFVVRPDKAPLEVIPTPAPRLIWPRMRSAMSLSHLQHPRIQTEIRRLKRSPDDFRVMMNRAEPYLRFIVDEVAARGLPMELALLPAVESSFRAHAYSPDGAAGLWQFMPATGRMFGLGQDWWHDKRRALEPSTRAALNYLSRLNKRFNGDWLHALAAYNAGARKVRRAIRQARRHDESTAFWALDLPGETDRYVPRLLAMAIVVADPARYGLELPPILDRPYFKRVDTGGQIDLNLVAELAGMKVEEVLALNPEHKRWASAPNGPHQLLLPVAKAESIERSLASLPESERLRWQHYRIQAGDSLGGIARRYGVSIQSIRQSNGLRSSRIHTGDDLLIPLSNSARNAITADGQLNRQTVHYRVRKGDSLYTIARRFQVSIADLRRWNQVGRFIRPGERLTVFLDPDA